MSTLMKTTLGVLLAGVVMAAPALATEAIGKATDLACTACHDKAGSRLLTDRGKFFETMGSLEGYDQLSTTFGRCTSCHVRKPGSPKLTKEGKRLAEVVDNMAELRKWLDERHPQPATDQD